ncbi:hypothetical protein C882_2805 [Caenispirillum salinarum AK4]|uniref:Uncharacterized protein n=1 Tax=Caenispirillum salinarum AK4 TaxID=1238182 RepID=K9GK36_9PROT|nr:hypothetical protein [Caenispirillum salinarum]EKV26370.1 hypothetical protein C882_2805 [Caenispirillum salinarum AK4]
MRGVLASMGVFLRQGIRPRTPLARAIVPVLLVKVSIVLLAKFFVFDDGRMAVPPDELRQHLSAPATAAPVRDSFGEN